MTNVMIVTLDEGFLLTVSPEDLYTRQAECSCINPSNPELVLWYSNRKIKVLEEIEKWDYENSSALRARGYSFIGSTKKEIIKENRWDYKIKFIYAKGNYVTEDWGRKNIERYRDQRTIEINKKEKPNDNSKN
jgi:hypothetical protein